jgi:plastocyanin
MDEENKTSTGYGKRPLWQWIILYVVVAVAIYGLVYYFVLAKKGGGYGNNSAVVPQAVVPTTVQTTPAAQNPTTGSAMEAQKITVTGSEFAFSPSAITLKKGQPAQITFKNGGTYPHNLTIADLNVKTKTIQPEETDTIQFTPDKTGQFSFICTVPGHADKGMKGILTVQ